VDLLAAVKPEYGVGLDFSQEMIKAAEAKHSHLHFILADTQDYIATEPFDVL
jgi:trans-aconitate methyltransferase